MGELPTGKDAVGIMVTPLSRRGCVTFRGTVVKVSNDRTQDTLTLYHVARLRSGVSTTSRAVKGV